MPPLTHDDPGAVGGYTLLQRLGAGGMGRVYLGRSPGGRPVAVKLVRPELADDPGFRARFRREVEAARRVSGLYTAPLVDADPEAEYPWLATGYVPGPSLQEAVERHGPFTEPSLRVLAAGLVEALKAIHGVDLVHRDLKPSNVLLASDGPRVIDFGISRAVDATALTGTGHVIGSPAFMSPEQANGHPTGPSSDVFSLGSVLAFAATGRAPFGQGHASALMYRIVHNEPDLAGVPEDLLGVVRDCLAKEPERRPGVGELVHALAAEDGRDEAAAGPAAVPAAWLPGPVDDELRERTEHLTATMSRPATVPLPGHTPPYSPPYAPPAVTPSRGWLRSGRAPLAVLVVLGLLIGGVAAWLSADAGGKARADTGNGPAPSSSSSPSPSPASPASSSSPSPSGTPSKASRLPSAGPAGDSGPSRKWDAEKLSTFRGRWEAHLGFMQVHDDGALDFSYRAMVTCAEAREHGDPPEECATGSPQDPVQVYRDASGTFTGVNGNRAHGTWGPGNGDYPEGSAFVLVYDPDHDAVELKGALLLCGPDAPVGWCGA